VGRILGEEPIQDRGARARQSEHEEGPLDALLVVLWMLLVMLDELQAIVQQAEELCARDRAAKGCELRFPFQGFEELAQAGTKGVAAEIAQACLLAGRLE
jgi:hypothetical protein